MKYTITWVVNFCENDHLKDSLVQFDFDWCKYSQVSELDGLNDHEKLEDNFQTFFTDQKYKKTLYRFWKDNDQIKKNNINVIIISDHRSILAASKFARQLKIDRQFSTNVGLVNANMSVYLSSYWSLAWDNNDYNDNMDSLFELVLFQNSTVSKRPFEKVFIFKNTNEGGEYGRFWRDEEIFNLIVSREIQLILTLSLLDETSVILKSDSRDTGDWARSFGGFVIFNDVDKVYAKEAKKVSKTLSTYFLNEKDKKWEIDYNIDLVENARELDCDQIISEITLNTENKIQFERFDSTKAWGWFNLKELKKFFDTKLFRILLETKEEKINFVKKSYSEVRSTINENLSSILSDNGRVATPQDIFNSYFKHKPFSVPALQDGIDEFNDLVREKRRLNKSNYDNGYNFEPFGIAEESQDDFELMKENFKGTDDFKLNQEEKKLFALLKLKSENLAHPLALIIRTTVISTLCLMLCYMPLTYVFPYNLVGTLLTFFVLSIICCVPFALMWRKYRKELVEIADLQRKYELQLKFNLTRKVHEFIFRKTDNFYEEYIKKCKDFKTDIDNFVKSLQKVNLSAKVKEESASLESVICASELVYKIPNLNISSDDNKVLSIAEVTSNSDRMFDLFRWMIDKNDHNLTDFLNISFKEINRMIAENLLNTKGNPNSLADLIFGLDQTPPSNIKESYRSKLLSILAPFRSMKNDDEVLFEVDYTAHDSSKINANIGIYFKGQEFNPEINSIAPNGVKDVMLFFTANKPANGLITLFSNNINESFYNRTKNYFENQNNRGKLNEILGFTIEDLVNHYGNSLEKGLNSTEIHDYIIKDLFKGFDGRRENHFENTRNPFVKDIMTFTRGIIDEKLSLAVKNNI